MFAFMGADFTAIFLRRLRALSIPYPPFMDYIHFITAVFCLALWLATFRKWPRVAPVLVLILCGAMVLEVPKHYVASRTVEIPVNRFLESEELESLQQSAHFPLFEEGSSDGTIMVVARSNEQRARQELDRIGISRAK